MKLKHFIEMNKKEPIEIWSQLTESTIFVQIGAAIFGDDTWEFSEIEGKPLERLCKIADVDYEQECNLVDVFINEYISMYAEE